MASPAPSRPTLREPDRRRCRRPPTTHQPQVAHPPGEPPDSSFLSPSRWFAPIRRHRAIIQLPDLGSTVRASGGLEFMGDPIPAISESEATGLIAEIFADIRHVYRVGVVNLIGAVRICVGI